MATASDSFTDSNGTSLIAHGGWSLPDTPSESITYEIQSNEACVSSPSTSNDVPIYNTNVTPGDDQYSQAVAATQSNGGPTIGVSVRVATDDGEHYAVDWEDNDPVNWYFAVIDNGGDGYTELSNGTMSTGDTVKLKAEGTTISFDINDVEEDSVTDATHSSGRVGLTSYNGATTDRADDWEGGDLSSSVTIQPVAGSLLFAGDLATFEAWVSITPNQGLIDFLGQSPSSSKYASKSVSQGALFFSGDSPATQTLWVATPEQGLISLEGAVPVITYTSGIQPNQGQIVWIGGTPTIAKVVVAGAPSAGSIFYAGGIPHIPGSGYQPETGFLLVKGLTPSTQTLKILTPNQGILTYSGGSPSAFSLSVKTPLLGLLTYVGGDPVIVTTGFVPEMGKLIYRGFPWGSSQITPELGKLLFLTDDTLHKEGPWDTASLSTINAWAPVGLDSNTWSAVNLASTNWTKVRKS